MALQNQIWAMGKIKCQIDEAICRADVNFQIKIISPGGENRVANIHPIRRWYNLNAAIDDAYWHRLPDTYRGIYFVLQNQIDIGMPRRRVFQNSEIDMQQNARLSIYAAARPHRNPRPAAIQKIRIRPGKAHAMQSRPPPHTRYLQSAIIRLQMQAQKPQAIIYIHPYLQSAGISALALDLWDGYFCGVVLRQNDMAAEKSAQN